MFGIAGMLLTAVLIVGLYFGRTARRKLALRVPEPTHLAVLLLLPTPLVLVSGEVSAWLADAYRWAGLPDWAVEQKDLADAADAVRQVDPWAAVLAVGVFGGLCPGVAEELFFRGFLGRGLIARWGRSGASC